MTGRPLDECMTFLLAKASQQVSREARDTLAVHGVTPAQYAALMVLWNADRQTASELGGALRLDSAAITGLADRLVQLGLVERRPDPHGDRRVTRLHLTAKGRAVRPDLEAAMEKVNAGLDERLGRQRSADLKAALRELGAGDDAKRELRPARP